jgi:hypothetical protein
MSSLGCLLGCTDRVRHVAGLGQFDLLLPVDGTATGFLGSLSQQCGQLIPAT